MLLLGRYLTTTKFRFKTPNIYVSSLLDPAYLPDHGSDGSELEDDASGEYLDISIVISA